MLATAGPVPEGPQWRYEFKWDGVRAVVVVDAGQATAFSRNDLDITSGYPELSALPDQLRGRPVVLDGELVALDAAGRPSFPLLQDRMHVRNPAPALVQRVPVSFYIFDVLHLDGASTLALPYEQRRALLDGLHLPRLPGLADTPGPAVADGPGGARTLVADAGPGGGGGAVGYVPRRFTDGPGTVAAARAFALEGVVAKLADSTYRPAERSKSWIKHAFVDTIEVVIIGHRPGRGRRAGTIGSLLVAIPAADGTLHFAGGVGTGFTDADLRHLQQALAGLRRATPPVSGVPREQSRDATWIEPVVVGEVAYRTLTPDRQLRHAAWRGVRPDKTPPPAPAAQPAPSPPSPEEVTGSLQTADGAWRVDIVRHHGIGWYRLIHGNSVVDRLQLPDLQQLLHAAGVDLADLTDTRAA
ncbi:non-homologous end-joining DNA ligase [Dactylosporangium vinaceum]|uniref:DNA ligase (ATP) n=1 Tax=Dactylosporangium vinaceum TaxID=53362 RepID=A0ABV5MSJ6_9ACTN|nr:non-homologous end-joining DNA ligase [Dactylosporangium vinaceum]